MYVNNKYYLINGIFMVNTTQTTQIFGAGKIWILVIENLDLALVDFDNTATPITQSTTPYHH